MKNNLIWIIAIVIAAGGGFWGGALYQKSRNPIPEQFRQFRQGQNMAQNGEKRPIANGAQGVRPISGKILSIEDKTITVEAENGNKIIIYSETTAVNKTSEGSLSDLTVGEEIMVIGAENREGTITADSISIGERVFEKRPPEDFRPEEN